MGGSPRPFMPSAAKGRVSRHARTLRVPMRSMRKQALPTQCTIRGADAGFVQQCGKAAGDDGIRVVDHLACLTLVDAEQRCACDDVCAVSRCAARADAKRLPVAAGQRWQQIERSEAHTSELLSLMRISYAVFC